jgi:hypothetical protein
MARPRRFVFCLLALFCKSVCSAAPVEVPHYSCVIKSVALVDEAGVIQKITQGQDNFFSRYIGSTFKIIKKTGEIDGAIVSNKGEGVRSTTVIDFGGRGQSYKALSIFGPKPSILYIQIDDLGGVGSRGPYKFSGFRWQEYISGICI